MEADDDRNPEIEGVLMASPTEMSLRLQVTNLLLLGGCAKFE